jgi:hypothetical protein
MPTEWTARPRRRRRRRRRSGCQQRKLEVDIAAIAAAASAGTLHQALQDGDRMCRQVGLPQRRRCTGKAKAGGADPAPARAPVHRLGCWRLRRTWLLAR